MLEQANPLLEILRFQMRLAKDLQRLKVESCGFAAKAVDEIGRPVGCWLRGKGSGAEPILKRWVATDVTTSPKVRQELKDFFLRHGVKQVATCRGNVGCPHEEGEGFPQGQDCPFCPFWKDKQGSGATEA